MITEATYNEMKRLVIKELDECEKSGLYPVLCEIKNREGGVIHITDMVMEIAKKATGNTSIQSILGELESEWR